MLAFSRRVLKLRSESQALLVGSMTIVHANDGVLAFERHIEGARMLCVFNLGTESRRWTPEDPSRWRVVLAANEHDAGDPWRLGKFSGFIARSREESGQDEQD
jgi:alpha-glucosidase